MTLGLLHRLRRLDALLDEVHHLAEVDEFIADDLVFLVQGDAGDIALGHFQIARALFLGGEHRADLGAQTLAEILHGGADRQAAFGERGLGAAIDDLQEQFAHGGVDGVADEVGIQSLKDGLADENFGGHGCRMGHAGAADRFDQSFLNDAVLHIQGQLAGTLLRCAPAYAMGEAGNVADFLRLYPLALFGDGSRAVVCALGNGTHVLNFSCVNHCINPFHAPF